MYDLKKYQKLISTMSDCEIVMEYEHLKNVSFSSLGYEVSNVLDSCENIVLCDLGRRFLALYNLN